MNGKLRILNLEDNPDDSTLIDRELRKGGLSFELLRVDSAEKFAEMLTGFAPDLILADYRLPTFDGLAALKELQRQGGDIPFIFVTGSLGEEIAVETLRRGATDYVIKDRPFKLVPSILRALEEKEARRQKQESELQLQHYREHLEEMVQARTRELEAAKIRAETANRAKNDFLATMSHELRTPLYAILGCSELLLNQEDERPETCRKNLRNIHESGTRLLKLISDILEFARLEPDDDTAAYESIDLGSFLDSALLPFREKASEKGIDLRLAGDGTAETFPIDPRRLRQVLVNLLDNAVKFTPPGGTVTVSLKPGERELELAVSDTGIGIPAQLQERVFEAFFQVDGTFSRHYGGTGLGLAIVQRLVSRMGGRVRLESLPQQGATFRCMFPAPKADRAGAHRFSDQPPQAACPCGSPGRVLLVEDTPVNLEVAAAMLENFGCRVTTATSGEEALELMTRNEYELVIMDCQMPGMDGFETTRRLRERERSAGEPSRHPIIAVTAHGFSEDREMCLAAGMDDYLCKPFSRDQLQGLLEKWMPSEDAAGKQGNTNSAEESDSDKALPPAPEADDGPLDPRALEQIRALQTEGGDLVGKVVDLFIHNAPELLQALSEAIDLNDAKLLERTAHSFKSSSANIGGLRLSQLCKELEMAARENRIEEGGKLLGAIRTEFPRVKQALQHIAGEDHDA